MNLRFDHIALAFLVACGLGACGSTQNPETLPNVDPVGTSDSKQPKDVQPDKADPTTGAGAANGEERGTTGTGAGGSTGSSGQ